MEKKWDKAEIKIPLKKIEKRNRKKEMKEGKKCNEIKRKKR